MSAKGTANPVGGTGDFYVMFAGALVNTANGAEDGGFVSTGF